MAVIYMRDAECLRESRIRFSRVRTDLQSDTLRSLASDRTCGAQQTLLPSKNVVSDAAPGFEMAVTKAVIIHAAGGSAQPAIIRSWFHVDPKSKNELVSFQMWVGDVIYRNTSVKPLGGEWIAQFNLAFQSPGSKSHRYKLTSDSDEYRLEWRSNQPAVSKYDCKLVSESSSEQQDTQQLLQDKISALCFNEEPPASVPVFDGTYLKLLTEWKGAAQDRQAVVESCAKLLKSRTDRIHTLQQKLREGSPARSGASVSHDGLKGATSELVWRTPGLSCIRPLQLGISAHIYI